MTVDASYCDGPAHSGTLPTMTETDPVDPYRVYTRLEAADFLRVSEKWLDELVKRGDLYTVRSGRRLLIPRAALTAYLRGEKFDPTGGIDGDDTATFPATPSMFREG